jgi:hypothetical protein
MASIRQAWRNPLARPADRAEAVARLCLVTMYLVILPVVAVLGSQAWHGVSATLEHQQQSRHPTTAQLLEDAPDLGDDDQGSLMSEQLLVAARWVAPDGAERTGSVPAAPGEPSGDRIEIWVDQTGNVSTPPPDPASVAVPIIIATIAGALLWGGLLIAAHYTFRSRLDRHRLARWDDEWRRIEPLWSGRSRDAGGQP